MGAMQCDQNLGSELSIWISGSWFVFQGQKWRRMIHVPRKKGKLEKSHRPTGSGMFGLDIVTISWVISQYNL